MKKRKLTQSLAALALAVAMTTGTSMTAFAKIDYGFTHAQLKENGLTDADIERLDRWANYTPSGEIKGLTFPKTELDIKNGFKWQNNEGGTEYVLHYYGDIGDPTSAGYTQKWYPNGQRYWDYDTWVCPNGTTIDYLKRVIENGSIKTATAEELGLAYEGGTVRDVPYDSNYPLKRVVDLYALNVENLTQENMDAQMSVNRDLYAHQRDISTFFNSYIICKLSGQNNPFQNEAGYSADLAQYQTYLDEMVEILRQWLNSFDFEHMTETERLQELKKMLYTGVSYDASVKQYIIDGTYPMNGYLVLVQKRGVCQNFAEAGHFLALLLGLKSEYIMSATEDHAEFAIQVDGVPYVGDNLGIEKYDHRIMNFNQTRMSYSYHGGEYIDYQNY